MLKTFCQQYGFDHNGRQTRLSLLNLGNDSTTILEKLNHTILTPACDELVDGFYHFLLLQKPMLEFLTGDSLVSRLKKAQKDYLLTIGINFNSAEYFESRMRIGLAHTNIGLPLSLYQCSYNYLQELISDRIQTCETMTQDEKITMQKYMLRITALDKSLAMEIYFKLNVANLNNSITALRRKSTSLKSEVDHDSLTQIYSRKIIIDHLKHKLKNFQTNNELLAVVVADIDNFKTVNDVYGHLAGDAVLKHIATRIQASLRNNDLVGRYGGEEFLILLPGISVEMAVVITERIRVAIEESPITFEKQQIKTTISLGITMATLDDDFNSLFNRADALMYSAKQKGRNCVSLG